MARLILKDGKPLTADEDKAERERLNDMIASPAAYAKHVKNTESEQEDGGHADAADAGRDDQHLHAGPAADGQERRSA